MPAILPTVLPAVALTALTTLLLAWAVSAGLAFDSGYLLHTLGLVGAGAALLLQLWRRNAARTHPFASVGAANHVTLLRGGLVLLMAGLLGESPSAAMQSVVTAIAALTAALDRLDGWLARRARMSSSFGARLDMETDALFVLVLSLLAWHLGRAGPWLLLAGLLRYAFVAATLLLPWMRRPLPFSALRRNVGGTIMTALILVVAPFVPQPLAVLVAAASLAALLLSFGLDLRWLWRARGS